MGKCTALLLALFVIAVFFIVLPLPVNAGSRTIVVPEDYQTISVAIENAAEGDTIFVREGTYMGPINQTLVIDKAITLSGEDEKTTIINLDPPLVPMRMLTLDYMGYLDAIDVESNNVKISGFTINTPGGVISIKGNSTQIMNNKMTTGLSVDGSYAKIVTNTIESSYQYSISLLGSYHDVSKNIIGGRASIGVYCEGAYNIIAANEITSSTQDGVLLKGSSNIIYGNTLTNENSRSIDVSGEGNLVAKNNLTIIGSLSMSGVENIAYSNIVGTLSTAGNNNTFIANNVQYGVFIGSTIDDASNITFCSNNFYFTPVDVRPPGEKIFEVWSGVHGPVFLDNGKEGNYWSDYKGSDWNFDGKGDTPYIIYANDTKNYEFTADFDISNIILTDNHPLMVPLDVSSVTIPLPEWAASVSSLTEEPSDSNSPKPFPTSYVAVTLGAIAFIVGASLLAYFRRRRR